MRTFAVFSMMMAFGCQDPYIADLAGNWVGTATGPNGQFPSAAQFRYDAEEDRPFSGTLDIGGWIYDVSAANSDNNSATVDLILNTQARACTIVAEVENENEMTGSYEINLCYAQATIPDPVACTETGTINLIK